MKCFACLFNIFCQKTSDSTAKDRQWKGIASVSVQFIEFHTYRKTTISTMDHGDVASPLLLAGCIIKLSRCICPNKKCLDHAQNIHLGFLFSVDACE